MVDAPLTWTPEGSRVLVTGASSGIGAATARLLSASGAVVGLVGRREDRLASVLADCRAHVPGCRMWVADLGDLERAEAIALEAWDAFGALDVLVNNAAVPKVRALRDLVPADVEDAMRVNFFSPARMTLAVLARMVARGSGWIVNVASVGGRLGISYEAAYCASKFALSGWSESLAVDLQGSGVEVRLVHPGPIDTDIWDRPGEPRALYYSGPKEPPDIVARGIMSALASDHFEHYFPELGPVVAGKNADLDGYLAFSAELTRQLASGEPGGERPG